MSDLEFSLTSKYEGKRAHLLSSSERFVLESAVQFYVDEKRAGTVGNKPRSYNQAVSAKTILAADAAAKLVLVTLSTVGDMVRGQPNQYLLDIVAPSEPSGKINKVRRYDKFG